MGDSRLDDAPVILSHIPHLDFGEPSPDDAVRGHDLQRDQAGVDGLAAQQLTQVRFDLASGRTSQHWEG